MFTLGNVGGTLTGGASVNLTAASSFKDGKASFVTPSHTRLEGRIVDVLVTQARTTASDPGVARGGLKIAFSDRESVEGCCSVSQGTVIIDANVRWPLSQPEALVDEAIEYLQALVFAPEFISAVKRGVLPA